MELEAIRRAFHAAQDINRPATLIFATDSMAILNRIKSGHLPQEWSYFREVHAASKVFWVYSPGHSGVDCNETADKLASSSSDFTPLELFPPQICGHLDLRFGERN